MLKLKASLNVKEVDYDSASLRTSMGMQLYESQDKFKS